LLYTAEEIMEFENKIGELAADLRAAKKQRKVDEAEYERNRGAVSNFRGKYADLAEVNRKLQACEGVVERLEEELRHARSSPAGLPEPKFDIQR